MRRDTIIQKFLWGCLFVVLLLMGNTTIYAQGFPEWQDHPLQIESKNSIFTQDNVNQLNQELSALAHPAKVIILENLDEPLDSYTKAAFEHYNLPQDQLLVIFVLDKGELMAVAGPELAKMGITETFIMDKITQYFTPFATANDYIGGMLEIIQLIDEEVELYNQGQTEGVLLPNAVEEGEQSKKTLVNTWFIWVLVSLGVLILLFGIGMWQRSRILHRLDDLEEFKKELEVEWGKQTLNTEVQPLQEELKIRLENLQSMLEDYRGRILASLTEEFIETEKLADRLRLFAARETIRYIEKVLIEANNNLKQFKEEVDHIEREKGEIPTYLGNIHMYLEGLDRMILDLSTKYGVQFRKLKDEVLSLYQEYEKYQALNEKGEVFDPQILKNLLNQLKGIEKNLQKTDYFIANMEEGIPNRLKDLDQKYKIAQERCELREGERLSALLKESREKWNLLITIWKQGRFAELSDMIQQIHVNLNDVEQVLQNEEKIREQLLHYVADYESRFEYLIERFQKDRDRLKKMINRYQLEEDPAMDLVDWIEIRKRDLIEGYTKVLQLMESRQFLEATEIIVPMLETLSELEDRAKEFHQRINSLSSEEDHCTEQLKSLRHRLLMVRQRIDRSLLPGKQDYLLALIEQGYDGILATEVLYDQIPLRLNKIVLYMNQATEQVEEVERIAEKMISSAQETEKLVSKLNVYRHKIPQIGQLLMMAENHFRDNEFEEALAVARKAEELAFKKRA